MAERRVTEAELLAETPLALLIAALMVFVAVLLALLWRARERARLLEREGAIRRDAIARSESAIRGRVTETMAPVLPGFDFEPGDARFLGSPVDFVVFDGLHRGECDRVVLVEIKSGSGALTPRERRVRDAVLEGRVEWRELHLDTGEEA
jgi:predicted Holliday junction resolvase-like endonuclease